MKTHKMGLIILTVSVSSCDSSGGGNDVQNYVEQFAKESNNLASIICTCIQDGPARSMCRNSREVLPATQDCWVDAYEQDVSRSADYLECVVDASKHLTECANARYACGSPASADGCLDDSKLALQRCRDRYPVPQAVMRSLSDCSGSDDDDDE